MENTDKKVAFGAALLLYAVMGVLILIGTAAQIKPEWFDVHGGDESMAWGIDWAIWVAVVFVLNIILICFSHKRLIFIPLYIGLFAIGFALSYIKPAKYWNASKVQVQCENQSHYEVKDLAFYACNEYSVRFDRMQPSWGRGADGYIPNDGSVVVLWTKGDGTAIKQPLRLWKGNKPPKKLTIIVTDDAVSVIDPFSSPKP